MSLNRPTRGHAPLSIWLLCVSVLSCRHDGGGSSEEGAAQTVVAVSVAPIQRATLRAYVDTWGIIEPAPSSAGSPPASARVATPVAGIIANVHAVEGQPVHRGEILFHLDSRVADVAVGRAQQAVEGAERVFARQQKLGAGEATSQKAFQEAEQNFSIARKDLEIARAERALLDIAAPLNGIVVAVNAKPGDAADPGTTLAEIIDLDRLVVSGGVRSADLPRLRIGQSVLLAAGSRTAETNPPVPLANVTARGTLSFIAPRLDPKSDMATIRVSVPRASGIRPGQFMSARIVVDEHRDRLAVPVESIVSENGSSWVSVVEAGRAVRHPVTVAIRDGNLVEVSGVGLAAGQSVVTEGAYGLPDKSRIRTTGR